MKKGAALFGILTVLFLLTACGEKDGIDNSENALVESTVQTENNSEVEFFESTNEAAPTISAPENYENPSTESTLIAEQILTGANGDIHYSYYLPKDFKESKEYPLMVVMPGYDMMWFGEDSSGSNLNWRGFLAWTELDEDMIVVSAQLTDWGEKSARQAIELTEYFLDNFPVDGNRYMLLDILLAEKLCHRLYPCARICMLLIYMVPHNGMEPLILLQKMELLFIFSWQKMTSITVQEKHGSLMTVCMNPIWMQA